MNVQHSRRAEVVARGGHRAGRTPEGPRWEDAARRRPHRKDTTTEGHHDGRRPHGGDRTGRTPPGRTPRRKDAARRRPHRKDTTTEGDRAEETALGGHHDGRRPRGGDRAGRTPRGEEATGDGGIRMGVAGRGEPGDGRGLELGRQPKPARTSVSGAPLVTALPTL